MHFAYHLASPIGSFWWDGVDTSNAPLWSFGHGTSCSTHSSTPVLGSVLWHNGLGYQQYHMHLTTNMTIKGKWSLSWPHRVSQASLRTSLCLSVCAFLRTLKWQCTCIVNVPLRYAYHHNHKMTSTEIPLPKELNSTYGIIMMLRLELDHSYSGIPLDTRGRWQLGSL